MTVRTANFCADGGIVPRKRTFDGGRISIALAPRELAMLRFLAERDQVSVSEVVRQMVRAGLRPSVPEPERVSA